MQKLRFIKGLLIGSAFSALFWIGLYKAITSISPEDAPQEQHLLKIERTVSKASL